ncbi:MAG: hypothetical protein JWM11_3647 [Planctomycetaceae bacterium]|nr:hypothetical protein [Planctomycetaceae bacterium]
MTVIQTVDDLVPSKPRFGRNEQNGMVSKPDPQFANSLS